MQSSSFFTIFFVLNETACEIFLSIHSLDTWKKTIPKKSPFIFDSHGSPFLIV